ncbi:autorepressor SdpR family transcription factor [Patescibacteria group bacterium]|nr:autorepressor SdpR family transcription factor [Patescibacteria group bacterium]
MDKVFKALSDPSRRQILTILKKGDMPVKDIKQHFDFTDASLSHHLDILKRADLVVTERKGQFIHYSLNTSVMDEVLKLFIGLFKK